MISKRLHQEGFFDSRAHLYLGELLNAPISLQIHSCFEHRVASHNQQHAKKKIDVDIRGALQTVSPLAGTRLKPQDIRLNREKAAFLLVYTAAGFMQQYSDGVAKSA